MNKINLYLIILVFTTDTYINEKNKMSKMWKGNREKMK